MKAANFVLAPERRTWSFYGEFAPMSRIRILTNDRVHLNEAGNRFVAETMLKCLGE
jgi:lysophospholipase L1-like esterase